MTACPKPPRPAKKPRQWNSTLPRPDVASKTPTSPSLLSLKQKKKTRGRAGARNTSLKKVNRERQAKRRKTYRQKLAAYKASVCYRYVEERAKNRCEFKFFWEPTQVWLRCGQRRDPFDGHELHHHHLTYARFGGKELPEDIQVVCTRHHAFLESQHPTRRRDYNRKSA